MSGGNTFLLLKELYDRELVDRLRRRVLSGVPYIGSSAGSNIAGTVIGTTNDFPLEDIPTRESLGILPAVFNPHHPDPLLDKVQYETRQWKISQYVAHHKEEVVIGVTNPGMLRIRGNEISLVGLGANAYVQWAGNHVTINSVETGLVSNTILKRKFD